MKTYQIAVIAGDGIGPDVVAEGGTLTPELGGHAVTEQVGAAVREHLKKLL